MIYLRSFRKRRNKKTELKSDFSLKVYNILQQIYPNYKIDLELSFRYNGVVLYWDFFIRELKIAVECHGEQHYRFNKLYHRDWIDFNRSKVRDNLKRSFAEKNNIALVEIPYSENIDFEGVNKLILESINERLYKQKS